MHKIPRAVNTNAFMVKNKIKQNKQKPTFFFKKKKSLYSQVSLLHTV